jgi:Zn-dependent protease
VRVHPLFWLVSALLGWPLVEAGFQYLLIWIGCVFVSILIHELGHVFMGRLFGADGYIVLYSFGGLAIGSNHVPRRYQRILVSAAGPGAQFLFFGLIYLALKLWVSSGSATDVFDPASELLVRLLFMLWWINLFWPLFNLLPIWPLDGGMITREVCEGASPERGRAVSLGISAVVSGVLAVHVLLAMNGQPLIPYLGWLRGWYMGLFFALFCISSFQALQAENSRRRRSGWDDDLPWER